MFYPNMKTRVKLRFWYTLPFMRFYLIIFYVYFHSTVYNRYPSNIFHDYISITQRKFPKCKISYKYAHLYWWVGGNEKRKILVSCKLKSRNIWTVLNNCCCIQTTNSRKWLTGRDVIFFSITKFFLDEAQHPCID